MWRAFDGFLTILPPGVIVRRYIGHLRAYRRHSHNPLQPQLSNSTKTQIQINTRISVYVYIISIDIGRQISQAE